MPGVSAMSLWAAAHAWRNAHGEGLGRVPEPQLPDAAATAGTDASAAVVDEHEVYFQGGLLPTRTYDRSKLEAGNRIPGPAVITEFDSTTVVLNGYHADVDPYLNLLINPDREEA